MKYVPPEQGPYESGITARSLFDSVDSLLKEHVTPEFKASIEEKYKPGAEKQWEHPEIKQELEKFVETYFFEGLEIPLNGFRELFRNGHDKRQRLKDYLVELEEKYGSVEEAYDVFSGLIQTLRGRKTKLSDEIYKIRDLAEADEFIVETAVDAYAHTSMVGIYIDIVNGRFQKIRDQL